MGDNSTQKISRMLDPPPERETMHLNNTRVSWNRAVWKGLSAPRAALVTKATMSVHKAAKHMCGLCDDLLFESVFKIVASVCLIILAATTFTTKQYYYEGGVGTQQEQQEKNKSSRSAHCGKRSPDAKTAQNVLQGRVSVFEFGPQNWIS
jgi:hypothetical protein